MVLRKKTSTKKPAASKAKKGKREQAKDIFVWMSRKETESASAPYLSGFVSIPAALIDSIESMCYYDADRESYQLDISLWKKGGGVLSGSIKKSWKADDDQDDDLDADFDDELEEEEDDEDYDEDEEEDQDEDETDDEEDEPEPVQRRSPSRSKTKAQPAGKLSRAETTTSRRPASRRGR